MRRGSSIDALAAELAQQRAALSAGDLRGLDQVPTRISAMLRGAHRSGDGAALAELRTAARRNAALLDAALKGVADARSMLGQIKAQATTQTYGASGARTTIGAGPAQGRTLRRV